MSTAAETPTPAAGGRRPLTTGKKVAFSALILLVALAGAEGVARVFYRPPTIGIIDGLGARHNPHPYLVFTAEPPVRRFPQGPDDPDAPGSIRIACLGGSTTRDGYPALLRDALMDRGVDKAQVVVFDAACQAYTSMESQLMLLIYVLPLKPDVVVVMHAHNDVQVRLDPGFRADYTHHRINPWMRLSRRELWRKEINAMLDCSRFVVLLRETATGYVSRNRILENYVCAPQFGRQTPRRNFEASSVRPFSSHMQNIYSACRGAGVRTIFLTQPLNPAYRETCHRLEGEMVRGVKRMSPRAFDEAISCHIQGQRECNDAVRQLCAKHGIELVDWAKTVGDGSGGEASFVDHVHLTEEGLFALTSLVADGVVRVIGDRAPRAER